MAVGTVNDVYADAQAAATGITGQLTTPANAVGSGATTSVTTGTTQNTDYANFFTFDESLFAGIPDTAIITALNLVVRDATGNVTRGQTGIRFDTVNGTQLAAESTTSPPTALGAGRNVSPATLPTVAQLKSPNFGVRVRYRRIVSQANSYTLDWLHVDVTYDDQLSRVSKDVELRWAVEEIAPTRIFTDLILQWRTLQPVGKSISLQWRTLGFVGKSVALQWRTLQSVGKSIELRWAVQAAIASDERTYVPDGVVAQLGYSNASTGNIAALHGDPDVSGGVGFRVCPVGSTVGQMRALVNTDLEGCTVGGMR